MAAYWIAHVTVTDANAYGEYAKRATSVIEAHGGEFLARASRTVWLEGNERARNVVVRFPSVEDAERCSQPTDGGDANARSSSNPLCTASTAASQRSRPTSTEILISLVVIMPMLIPASERD